MYPSDLPPGYVEAWRKLISVYPPVPVETLQAALGGGYPGAPSMYPLNREVRVNAEKGRIEIWERTVQPAKPASIQWPNDFQAAAQAAPQDARGEPGTARIVNTK